MKDLNFKLSLNRLLCKWIDCSALQEKKLFSLSIKVPVQRDRCSLGLWVKHGVGDGDSYLENRKT